MESQRKLRMVFAPPRCIPKGKARNPNGDDASFAAAEAETIGVADGVGGCWARNVDPSKYSRQLMAHARTAAAEQQRQGQPVDPHDVLTQAYSKTTAEGASTACIVTHRGGGVLRAANVGDSGFLVFRNNKMVFKSELQHWQFNSPFYLSPNDGPELAAEMEIPVDENDVIVLGTDGLWDNVFPGEVEGILENIAGDNNNNNNSKVVDLNTVSIAVTNLALINSHSAFYDTPFSLASKLHGRRDFQGGKRDDITVIVAQIISL